MEPRYFLYVSQTKVDMLHAQIPRGFMDGLAGELGVALGVVSATLKQDSAPSTVFSRLAAVEKYLESAGSIGSLDRPFAYFRGTMDIRWGPYGGDDRNMVYFGGATPTTILGLGGSAHHVIGSFGASSAHSASATPYLLAVLASDQQLPPIADQEIEGLALSDMTESALLAVELASKWMKGPAQRIEFLAKRLLRGVACRDDQSPNQKPRQVLLGSPIYVAAGD